MGTAQDTDTTMTPMQPPSRGGQPRALTLPWTLALLASTGCFCGVLGWMIGIVLGPPPYLSSAPSGNSSTQQAMMEEVRSTLVAQTAEAIAATEGSFGPDLEQINVIREFHALLELGKYEAAWCLTSQVDLPWGDSYQDFARYWSEHPARLAGPVVPIEHSIAWLGMTLAWQGPPYTEERFEYRVLPGSNGQCTGWLIADVRARP